MRHDTEKDTLKTRNARVLACASGRTWTIYLACNELTGMSYAVETWLKNGDVVRVRHFDTKLEAQAEYLNEIKRMTTPDL